eukprot:RCo000081
MAAAEALDGLQPAAILDHQPGLIKPPLLHQRAPQQAVHAAQLVLVAGVVVPHGIAHEHPKQLGLLKGSAQGLLGMLEPAFLKQAAAQAAQGVHVRLTHLHLAELRTALGNASLKVSAGLGVIPEFQEEIPQGAQRQGLQMSCRFAPAEDLVGVGKAHDGQAEVPQHGAVYVPQLEQPLRPLAGVRDSRGKRGGRQALRGCLPEVLERRGHVLQHLHTLGIVLHLLVHVAQAVVHHGQALAAAGLLVELLGLLHELIGLLVVYQGVLEVAHREVGLAKLLVALSHSLGVTQLVRDPDRLGQAGQLLLVVPAALALLGPLEALHHGPPLVLHLRLVARQVGKDVRPLPQPLLYL